MFLATLVALHFNPVSKSLGRSVLVWHYRSLELASLLFIYRRISCFFVEILWNFKKMLNVNISNLQELFMLPCTQQSAQCPIATKITHNHSLNADTRATHKLGITQCNTAQCNSHYSLTTYLYASFISLLLTRCTIPTSQGVLFSQGTLGNHGALFWQSSHMYIHRRSVKARYLVKPWYLVMAMLTCLNHVTSVKQGTLV